MPLGFYRINSLARAAAAPGPSGPHTEDGVSFNGSSYYRTTSITNNMSATSREGTCSLWYKDDDFASRTATQRLFAARSSGYLAGVALWVGTNGVITFYGYDGENNGWVMQQANTTATALNDGNWHHIVGSWDRVAANGNSFQLYIDGSAVTIASTRYTDKEDGNDLIQERSVAYYNGTTSVDPFSIAQIWWDDTRYDLSTDIDKFYDSANSGPVDMGTDGTSSGLGQPACYHYGNTTTFGTNNGRTSGSTYMTYTMSATGTISDTDTDS